MKPWLPSLADLLIVLGLTAVAIGAGLVHTPTGVITAGLALLVLGLLKALKENN
jgi:hypothetical protein